jgi:hypothetical protein
VNREKGKKGENQSRRIMSKGVLETLAIYSPTLLMQGESDVEKKLLYYQSLKTTLSPLNFVGICEALVGLTYEFDRETKKDTLIATSTTKKTLLIFEVEIGFWYAACFTISLNTELLVSRLLSIYHFFKANIIYKEYNTISSFCVMNVSLVESWFTEGFTPSTGKRATRAYFIAGDGRTR